MVLDFREIIILIKYARTWKLRYLIEQVLIHNLICRKISMPCRMCVMKRVFNSCISKLEDKCTLKISCKNSKLSSFKSGKLVKLKIFYFFGTFIIKLEPCRNPTSIVICKSACSENEPNDRFKTPPIISIWNYSAKNVSYLMSTIWNLCFKMEGMMIGW